MASVTREKSTAFPQVGASPPVNCTSYLPGRKECALRGHCKHRDHDRPELCTTRGFLKDDALAYRRNFEIHSPENRSAVAVNHG